MHHYRQKKFQTKDVDWVKKFSSNFLVLGGQVGNSGLFENGENEEFMKIIFHSELILLLISILFIFSFYTFLSYHAIYKSGNDLVSFVIF